MLSVADGTPPGLCDAHWCGQVVEADSVCGLLAAHGRRIVSDADLAACYPERRGRPSIPPSHLAKPLLLADREGASDEQALGRLRYDLRGKVALGVRLDHPGYTRPRWSSSAPACCCTASSAWPSSARSRWRASWG